MEITKKTGRIKISNFKGKVLATLAILLYTFVLYFLPISCVFLSLTGMKCPGCGMTRAVVSALRLDFKGAFGYHKMFWSLPFLYIAFLKDGKLFKKKAFNVIFYLIIILGFLLNWIF